MSTTITDPRSPRAGYRLNDSPARWQKALARAVAEGVAVRQLATSGAWVASSGTDGATAYVVTVTGCECRAGAEGDVCCKHRAALRHRLGMLDLDPEPDPSPPAAPVALPVLEAEDWGGFWERLYAAHPGIAPGPVASMSDLAIAADPRSLPAISGGSHDAEARYGVVATYPDAPDTEHRYGLKHEGMTLGMATDVARMATENGATASVVAWEERDPACARCGEPTLNGLTHCDPCFVPAMRAGTLDAIAARLRGVASYNWDKLDAADGDSLTAAAGELGELAASLRRRPSPVLDSGAANAIEEGAAPYRSVDDTRDERAARHRVSDSAIAARMPAYVAPPACRLCRSSACPGC